MTMIPTSTLSGQLEGFFNAYDEIRGAPETSGLSARLAEFFRRYGACRRPPAAARAPRATIDAAALAAWLADLEQPLLAARLGAFDFDPWAVADLGRDELRNTRVLSWLLNPRGNHGLGNAGLSALLAAVNRHFQSKSNDDAWTDPGRFCRVRTEINPNGEIDDRVDIEIDAEKFYLIVEVKIDAPEQPGQLERYGLQAEVRAAGRAWAVIFLTPGGFPPTTAGKYAGSARIVPLSWKSLALVMKREISGAGTPNTAPDQALSRPRQLAAYAAWCFLKKIRSF